ncbi:MAG: alpha/beta family hydrolase [Ilumatobacter sp.]|uniref:alpha/beta hydrolase family protein n=1 Tax=Ilumatobacter sp. TaxID=1967498 RepID=UPI003C77B7CA
MAAALGVAAVREAATVTPSLFTQRTRPAGLVLTPGASADRDHHTLVAIDEAFGDLPVLRLTLGTNRVPSAVKKIVAAGEAFADELGVGLDRLAYGGRSFGGRSCSVAVAEGLPAAALVLLSYPLHPPGRPDNLRVGHFPDINVPTLFVSGRRDPFGTPDEFEHHVPSIAGTTTLEWVEGNHAPKDDGPVIGLVSDFLGY